MIISLYFLRVIYTYDFCLYLAFSFLSPLLINLLFFESCGFSYTTQTPCHSGGTNVDLGWGESKGRELLIMLSYLVNLVLFA